MIEALTALEDAAKAAGCSRLFVVVAQATPLRRIFENVGYGISLAGGELTWLEKGNRSAVRPMPSYDIKAGMLATRTEATEAPAAITGVNEERRDWH